MGISYRGGSGMNIKETLDCVDTAWIELENVELMDLPDDLQQYFIQAHILLLHISTVLEMKLKEEEVECLKQLRLRRK